MSNAMLWINHTDSTATITGVNVSYTMPLWAFEDMRDIIAAEAEKKVEVTHRDFDIQQELLDRYRADNRKLRELLADMGELLDVLIECDMACKHYHDGCIGDCYYVRARRELGVEVTE